MNGTLSVEFYLITFITGVVLLALGIVLFVSYKKKSKAGKGKETGAGLLSLIPILLGTLAILFVFRWIIVTRDYNEKYSAGYSAQKESVTYDESEQSFVYKGEEYIPITTKDAYASDDYLLTPVASMSKLSVYDKFWYALLNDGSHTVYQVESNSGFTLLYDGVTLYNKASEAEKVSAYYADYDNYSFFITVTKMDTGEMQTQEVDINDEEMKEIFQEIADATSNLDEDMLLENAADYSYQLTFSSTDKVMAGAYDVQASGEDCFIGIGQFKEDDDLTERTSQRQYWTSVNDEVGKRIVSIISNMAWG